MNWPSEAYKRCTNRKEGCVKALNEGSNKGVRGVIALKGRFVLFISVTYEGDYIFLKVADFFSNSALLGF